MRTLLLLILCGLLCVPLAGCNNADASTDWQAIVAADLAMAAVRAKHKPAPAPEPAPAPKPDGDTGAKPEAVGGPLDTIKNAKDLIAKGNRLADQAEAILDAAKKSGKVTIDIKIPVTADVKSTPLPEKPATHTDATADTSADKSPNAQPSLGFSGGGCANGRCSEGVRKFIRRR